MDKEFFSIPLSALSIKEYDFQQLCRLLIRYGVVEFSKMDCWRSWVHEDDSDEYYASTAYTKAFRFKKIDSKFLLEDHLIVEEHIQCFESRYGKDAYFRIGRDLLMDAYLGKISEREIRIYAAIRSVLGANKQYVRITLERISYRMLGYKTREAFIDSRIEPITKWKIRTSTKKLVDRGLIVSFTNKSRYTYYSTRLTLDELIETVANSVAKKVKRRGINNNEKYQKFLAKALQS